MTKQSRISTPLAGLLHFARDDAAGFPRGVLTPVIWYHDQRRKKRFWKLSKFNAAIMPVDDLSIEELATRITRWRERALAQPSANQ